MSEEQDVSSGEGGGGKKFGNAEQGDGGGRGGV